MDGAKPTRFSLTCHKRAAWSSSYDALLEVFCLLLTKYRPLTVSTSGDEAR